MSKNFLASKTIQGILVMVLGQLLPAILPVFGIDFTADDGTAIAGAVEAMLTSLGAIWAIIGRFTAKKELTVL